MCLLFFINFYMFFVYENQIEKPSETDRPDSENPPDACQSSQTFRQWENLFPKAETRENFGIIFICNSLIFLVLQKKIKKTQNKDC